MTAMEMFGVGQRGRWSVPAQYEYGPFGELIRATGPMAKLNPFRFSTKYDDDESDLYYGYNITIPPPEDGSPETRTGNRDSNLGEGLH